MFILAFGGCRKKSNPVNPSIEGDFPSSSKFAVTLYSPVSSVAVRESFEVRVVLYNVTNVSGCAIEVSYPSSKAGSLIASPGSLFFPSESAISISRNEPDSGRVSLGIAYTNTTPAQSISGSGVVWVLLCKATSAGICSFVIDPNTLEIKGPDGTLIKNFDSLLVENTSVSIH